MKRIFFAFFLTLSTLLGGCASQSQQTGYAPSVSQSSGFSDNQEQGDVPGFVGLVVTKNEDNTQTVLYLGSDVATETAVGTEIYDTFLRNGWVQVTHADANNQTEIDVVCRMGARGDKVSVECLSDSRVAPAKATGSVIVDQGHVAEMGLVRIRQALVGLVIRQRNIVVNEAVRLRRLQSQ